MVMWERMQPIASQAPSKKAPHLTDTLPRFRLHSRSERHPPTFMSRHSSPSLSERGWQMIFQGSLFAAVKSRKKAIGPPVELLCLNP